MTKIVEFDDERDTLAGIRELIVAVGPDYRTTLLDWRYAHTLLLEIDYLQSKQAPADTLAIARIRDAVDRFPGPHVGHQSAGFFGEVYAAVADHINGERADQGPEAKQSCACRIPDGWRR